MKDACFHGGGYKLTVVSGHCPKAHVFQAVSAGRTWSLVFKSVQNLSVSPAQKEGQRAVRRTHPEALSFLMSPVLMS